MQEGRLIKDSRAMTSTQDCQFCGFSVPEYDLAAFVRVLLNTYNMHTTANSGTDKSGN